MVGLSDLQARGVEALRTGTTVAEEPLRPGGRWGISVVLRPPESVLSRLCELARSAADRLLAQTLA